MTSDVVVAAVSVPVIKRASLHVIADRSGSMSGKQSDVVGGINNFIVEQQAAPGEAWMSLVQFDTEYEVNYLSVPIAQVKPMTLADYTPRGYTALLDALGRSMMAQDVANQQISPDVTIVVVVTDGFENASKEFTLGRIKEMIQIRETMGWKFIYLGAGPDAFDTAAGMGISGMNTASYSGSAEGTRAVYRTAARAATSLRSGSMNAGLGRVVKDDE